MKKKIFTCFLALVANLGTTFAVKVQIGDLYYNLDSQNNTAEVTYHPWTDTYAREGYKIDSIVIPSRVSYQSVVYNVVRIGEEAFYTGSSSITSNYIGSITLPSSIQSIGEDAFAAACAMCINEPENTTYKKLTAIYVPCGELSRFQQMVPEETRFKYLPSIYTITGEAKNGYVDYTRELTICDTMAQVSAYPYEGYHFVQWSDGNTDNPRTIVLTQDTTFTAEFARNPIITYKYNSKYGRVIGDTTTPTGSAVDNITFKAYPNRGYQFIRWADGNTDNPRTIELTQDTIMEAIFDYILSGKCGKDSALTWTFEPASMALNITGKGALSENYTYGTFIESLTIGNEITTIGERAFYGCSGLKNVILGTSVKVLEHGAFAYCSSIESITCYSMRPPTVNTDALYGLDYSTIVYVPADYLNTYKMHDAWGLYDVRPLGAKGTETTNLSVTPAETTADIAWPQVSEATTYELVIKDKPGNVICTLIFNAQGQLKQIVFNAPSRDQATQQTQAAGFSFTVTGLENGTSYDLTITSKDNSGTTLDTKTISFTTTGEAPLGIEDVLSNQVQCTKVMRNGQIFILRGDKTYTLTGQETIMP